MNLPPKQPDVIDLTRSIRDVHYQLLLDYQAMMLKVTALESENEDLKERLKQIEDALRKFGPHYGGKYIQESELDDPIIQKLLDKYKYGRQGEDELVYTSGSGDKRNPQDVERANKQKAYERKIRTTKYTGRRNY